MGKLSAIIIGTLLFSGIIIAVSLFVGDLSVNYGVSSANLGFLNRSQDVANQINKISDRTTSNLSSSEVQAFNPLPAIEAVKLSSSSIDIATSMIGDISDPSKNNGVTYLQIPSWLSVILVFSVTLIVVFAILKAWLKIDV
jgi:hypothetical protein